MTKFNELKNRLIVDAQNKGARYLLAKYGSVKLIGDPTVDLNTTEGLAPNSVNFSGTIHIKADTGVLKTVDLGMTINDNDIEVTSEDVQSNITNALNSAEQNKDLFVASLNGFHLTDDGSKYLKVSHTAAQDSVLGIVGKGEYSASKDKAALLQGILKDAAIAPKVEFTGSFTEPMIEKEAKEKGDHQCDKCDDSFWTAGSLKDHKHNLHESKKEAALSPTAKATWLTAELFKDAEEIEYTPFDDSVEVKAEKTYSIQENMPRAKSADHLVQAAQLEDQSANEAQMKVEHEAANELMSTLQGMGYGSAKAVEITSSKEGFDIMTAVDHAGAVKAVSIPVTVKEGKYLLPKKSIIATLIEKGLNVQAKLAEQFDLETLEKLAAIDERMAYEANEVVSILTDKVATVEKEAAGEKQPFFDSDDSTMTVQKHLLPNHEDYKVGDKISDGTDQYEIVNQDGNQNSKGEGDGSLWALKKCQDPERDDKKVKNQIPS
jgi:hypothetical protein